MKKFFTLPVLFAILCGEVWSASLDSSPPGFAFRNKRRQPQPPQIIFAESEATTPSTRNTTTTQSPPMKRPAMVVTTVPPASTPAPGCKTENEELKLGGQISEDEIRLKLCPNTTLREYRFDVDAKMCSLVGKQSHCGKNMIFYSFAGNKIYGHCDCDYSSEIPLLYHAETKRCYFIYQQAFCKIDEWLEMRREDGKAVCTPNKCYNSGRVGFGAGPLAARDVQPEYVPFRGSGPCVKLNQPNKQLCTKKGDIVTFRWPLQFYPNCGEAVKTPLPGEMPAVKFLGDVQSLRCNPGSYLSTVGDCQPEWEFD